MEILISAERIQERVGELAREISRHFRGRPITIIGVLTGSLIFLLALLAVVVVFLFTKPLMTLLARRKFFASGHKWSGLDPKGLGAKPPLRRTRRPSAPVDPKEA